MEHLDSPVLDDVPYSIFGILRPHVVVMTTPNAEYNVLFPEFSGFRHPDHRFEWTRHQFQTWYVWYDQCTNLLEGAWLGVRVHLIVMAILLSLVVLVFL